MNVASLIAKISIATAALGMASAALADAIVVRSTGPSAATYPVGRRLPPAQRVVLQSGDRVVLVGEGGTRTLSGPGNFPVRAANQASQGAGATLSRYLSTSGGAISRTGAVRGSGVSAEPSAPNLWVVDVARSGTVCVADMSNITLWRGDMTQDTLLTVTEPANGGHTASLAFVTGQNFRAWPSDAMPVAEGVDYRISGPGMATPTTIRFVSTPLTTSDPAAIAAMLADKGCTGQLAQLGTRLDNAGG